MKPSKILRNCRGWLPKEPNPLPSNQKTGQNIIKQKITTISARTIGGLALGTGILSLFLLIVPYHLFPDSYTPKSNPNLGYTAPNNTASGIVLAVAICCLFLAITLIALFIKKMNTKDSQ